MLLLSLHRVQLDLHAQLQPAQQGSAGDPTWGAAGCGVIHTGAGGQVQLHRLCCTQHAGASLRGKPTQR